MRAVPERSSAGEALPLNLSGRYLLALAVVAGLVVLDAVAIQPMLVRLTSDAPVINVAGRQRMLSQRLTKAALAIEAASDNTTRQRRERELSIVLEQWTQAHESLQFGNDTLRIPETQSDEILDAFARLQPHFEAMREAGRTLCSLVANEAEQFEPDSAGPLVEIILENEAKFLPVMDRIVGLYEQEARARVSQLRLTKLTIMAAILVTLLGVGMFVLRPATRLIDEQFRTLRENESQLREAHHVLELRVEERTRQLSESNRSLEREIHERELAQERTREVLDQLTHASRVTAIGQMATGLAHELNQPLGAISNYAETCERTLARETPGDGERERIREVVLRIQAAALRAGKIIRRMRGFVQARRAQRETIDINRLISDVQELCQTEARRADVAMRLQLDDDVPMVAVDPIQIQQVLVNIIQNAIQALLAKPRDAREVVLSSRRIGSGIEICVADNGPGFDGDPMASFRPFRTSKEDGLGIGLSISQSIMHEHQGEICARNRAEGGAVVCVTIPIGSDEGYRCHEQSGQEARSHSLCS
ncbi:Sensor protein FixL [Maioricimonas rarisocia]|uniref:histidine kinase n=1 Tax=Maioricimonas rarisocia TaxID=2528026 RepID=A0A517Z3C0_9PLAN|nr:ATP-binding protein [Maioricimonas rarisocia]QDU36992.1 Sensor protein FixL [Maioricimonas rarisocia]